VFVDWRDAEPIVPLGKEQRTLRCFIADGRWIPGFFDWMLHPHRRNITVFCTDSESSRSLF
jgi:hypothetical protein